MAEQASVQNSPNKNYSVLEMYKKSWATVKSNLWPLVAVSVIGAVLVSVVAIVAAATIISNFPTTVDELGEFFVSFVVAAILMGLAGLYSGLLQIVSLKSGVETGKVEIAESLKQSIKVLPRALLYGLFVIALLIAAGLALVLLGSISEVLALLGGIALVVAVIIAMFRYAFVQYIVVEPKDVPFLERFRLSQKLTNGIYSLLLMMWLMAFLLGIGFAIVTTIITAPFNDSSTSANNTSSLETSLSEIDENASAEDQINAALTAFNDALDEEITEETEINGGYVATQLISQILSSGLSLVILGAFLHLYRQRTKDTKTAKKS